MDMNTQRFRKHVPSSQPSPRGSGGKRAFTLIELLVAISITIIMLGIINQILFSTTEAVSMGAGTSDIIGASRVIGERISRDAAQMLTPSQNILVIINRRAGDLDSNGVFAAPPTEGVAVMGPGGESIRRWVRSDHLVFFRAVKLPTSDPAYEQPLCPQSATSLSNDLVGPIDAGRIWYGHGLRTRPDGTSDVGALLGHRTANLGVNAVASDWILCRHLLMFDSAAAFNYTSTAPAYTNNATVSNHLASGLTLNSGVTDLARVTRSTVVSGVSANYAVEAPKLAFETNRLLVNPTLNGSVLAGSNVAQGLARMHSMLAARVSDFIVEFAGDYVTGTTIVGPADGNIDTHTDGSIKWYTDFSTKNGPAATDWPNTWQPDVDNTAFQDGGSAPIYTNDANGGVFIWRAGGTNYPHLIRIRYRLNVSSGKVGDGRADPSDPYSAAAREGDPGAGRWFEVIIPVNRG